MDNENMIREMDVDEDVEQDVKPNREKSELMAPEPYSNPIKEYEDDDNVAPSHHPSAPLDELFNISTTVDPSYIISLIRKLLPRDVKNGHDSDGVDACNASNQGLKTNHMKESVVSPCEDEMLNSSHDKIETMDTLDGFDELARQEKTGEVSCSRFEDSSISVREKAWEEYGCILWDLAASRIHAEFMVIEFIAFYLLSFGVAHCLVRKLPTTYLGLPLGAIFKSPTVWDVVEERFHKREFLWRRVIVGKSEEELGGWCSLVEREICCWGAFKAMTRFLVGDQRKIKFWQDVWQWSAPLKVVWNLGFKRQFQDWELDSIEELLRRLQVFGKCSEDEEKLIWKASKGDNFSVNHSFSTLESDGGVSFHSKVRNLMLEVLLGSLIVSQSMRVTEISLGILGNLACHEIPMKQIASTDKLIEIVVDQLFLDDTSCLCEACRLLTLGLQGSECVIWAKALQSEHNLCRVIWVAENTLNPQLLEKVKVCEMFLVTCFSSESRFDLKSFLILSKRTFFIEQSIGLLLAILESQQEVVSILLPTLMNLGLSSLLINLLTFEMSKLASERIPER
ncbi:hypothetical protein CK203_068349 [Vitis vinifera]|uniref:Uncharacterized protein n=1 Tax=Vitis vinifera TaxID=29760 RepID=A0A438F445_VITVI|nr:hypothetical protein CK203_068349 [Vitis vinifera]